MLVAHFFDLIPIWVLLIGTILVMMVFIEYGFRLGRKAQAGAKKAQTSQVRAIMGAGLGLLAFMLAFTFSTAQSHFESRVQNLAQEALIARNIFMQADLLAEPDRTRVKQLLKDYIGVRMAGREYRGEDIADKLADILEQSEQIQRELWQLATKSSAPVTPGQEATGSSDHLIASVLTLTDIHYSRLHAAAMNRIPLTIWMTLYLMAVLSMVIMGYQAGLTDRRSPVATVTLAVAFSAVIILITDLDRPIMSFFDIDDQLIVGLYEDMEADLSPQYYPGDQSQ